MSPKILRSNFCNSNSKADWSPCWQRWTSSLSALISSGLLAWTITMLSISSNESLRISVTEKFGEAGTKISHTAITGIGKNKELGGALDLLSLEIQGLREPFYKQPNKKPNTESAESEKRIETSGTLTGEVIGPSLWGTGGVGQSFRPGSSRVTLSYGFVFSVK